LALPDPETERKLLAVEELMKAQKLEYDKVQKELVYTAEKEEERNAIEKRAEDELRSRYIMIPWPTLWRRG
jgi:hypothetical protein